MASERWWRSPSRRRRGGGRLIGLAPSLYRLWSRVRYVHLRADLERRIARPFLAAAPGRGAQRAVVETSWRCEYAAARREHAAVATVDLKQDYEQITVAEVMRGAREHGLPLTIAILAADLYLSPRCVRVDGCYSKFVRPRRSILAGCTWATVIIRLIMISPSESFIAMLRKKAAERDAYNDLTLYIDDGILVTTGQLDAVTFVHAWACRMLISWVHNVLRKQTAEGKLQCIASSPELCRRLKASLGDDGFRVSRYGDVLGTGMGAGGRITKRTSNACRLKKAMRRRNRINWLRSRGGKAHNVVKCGIRPAVNYEAAVSGIDNRAMRGTRRAQGATCRIRCGGTSLTTRLAVGGDDYNEIDPWVLDCAAPLRALTSKLWDEPRRRAEMVMMWRAAVDEIGDGDSDIKWRNIRGTVGASLAHVLRVGGAWPKPFVIRLLDHDVNLLSTPPRQVEMVMKRHARQQLDRDFLRRIAAEHRWDVDDILKEYPYGIDWKLVRQILRGRILDLSPAERHAYHILISGAFWTEEKRWRAGYTGHGSCAACSWEIGSIEHKVVECGAMAASWAEQVASGRFPARACEVKGGMEPLHYLGLPPLRAQITPSEFEYVEGGLQHGYDGLTFGDGSGYYQDEPETRVATWSLVRAIGSDGQPAESLRGNVGGWLSTVPRGEMLAYFHHLRDSGPGGVFVGDCAMVVRAAIMGVSAEARSSANINADIWRMIHDKHKDRGLEASGAIKTKAHRSLRAAELSSDDPLHLWEGNRAADAHAKQLAKTTADCSSGHEDLVNSRRAALEPIARAAFAVDWNLRRWPELGLNKARKPRRIARQNIIDTNGHQLIPRGIGAWECGLCRLWARGDQGRRALLRRRCNGSLLEQSHPTHRTRFDYGVLWCDRCGAFSARLLRNLRQRCRGAPASEAQRNVLRRLRQGLRPTTAAYLLTDTASARREPVQNEVSVAGGHDRSHAGRRKGPTSRLSTSGRRRHEHPASNSSSGVFHGVYLRLAGGPSHHGRPAAAGAGASLIDHLHHAVGHLVHPTVVETPTASADAPTDLSHRRSLSADALTDSQQFTSVDIGSPSTGTSSTPPVQERSGLCRPSSVTPWTKRITFMSTRRFAAAAECGICGAPCKTLCRGCDNRICAQCAKLRRACIVVNTG